MAQDKHYYRTCRDADCQRLPCVAYKEGYADGYADATAAAAEDTQ